MKETLNIKKTAHDNKYQICGIKREVENHSLELYAGNGKLGGA